MPIASNRLPTWSEFLYAAKKQGIEIAERDLKMVSPAGPEPPVRYVQKPGGPKIIVPPLQLGDLLQEPLFSNLCRRLGMDPMPLGISLEELEPEDEL